MASVEKAILLQNHGDRLRLPDKLLAGKRSL
jgi:hypothetical protein